MKLEDLCPNAHLEREIELEVHLLFEIDDHALEGQRAHYYIIRRNIENESKNT